MKKITSLTMVWTLIILLLNSVVLYVVPEGRVAYWADWRFLGLTKADWGAQHTTVGFLFLTAGMLHLYYNWKSIVAYMKNRARQFKFFTVANLVALVLSTVFVVGTYVNVPPMSTIMEISEHFKDRATKKYGEPPYGHAESSSLKMFTTRQNLNLEKSTELLQGAGIAVTSDQQTIKELAISAGLAPQGVYEIIKPAANDVKSVESAQQSGADRVADFLNAPKSGLGKMTIADICTTYGLDQAAIISGLIARGYNAEADRKLKEISDQSGTTPMAIYEAMVAIVSGEAHP